MGKTEACLEKIWNDRLLLLFCACCIEAVEASKQKANPCAIYNIYNASAPCYTHLWKTWLDILLFWVYEIRITGPSLQQSNFFHPICLTTSSIAFFHALALASDETGLWSIRKNASAPPWRSQQSQSAAEACCKVVWQLALQSMAT